MTVNELQEYLKQHGLEIGEQLRNGTYQPKPVRRVEIPKPDGQKVRKLGIRIGGENSQRSIIRVSSDLSGFSRGTVNKNGQIRVFLIRF